MSEVTNVIVPGRGHILQPDGNLVLSPSAIARVETTRDYYDEHVDAFAENGGTIDFEGGWAAAAGGVPQPPIAQREGRLMRNYGRQLGIPDEFTVEGIDSTSSMDNFLKAREYFLGAAELVIVTQLSQADRFLYVGAKTLPGTKLTIVEAPGEDDPAIHADEQRLLKQSKVLYGWVRGPRMLHFADRAGTIAGNLAGLKPASKYTSTS